MSNAPEKMPSEIWAHPEIGSFDRSWYDCQKGYHNETPYTRTDTIPTRAQIAREFMEDLKRRIWIDHSIRYYADAILTEMEEADGKSV